MGNRSWPVPRLWFGTDDYALGVDRQGDCQCDACPMPATPVWTRGYADGLAEQLVSKEWQVQLSRDVYLSHPVRGNAVALSAQGGRVVVLDEQARRLFSALPATRSQLRARLPSWSDGTVDQVAALLLTFGILSSPQVRREPLRSGQSPTLAAWLHLTDRCTLNCTYCYVRRGKRRMSPDTARRTVEALFRSAQAHHYTRVKLKYAGGEPTLNFVALLAAQKRAEQLSMQTGIALEAALLTNGIRVSDEQIDALLAHNVRVTISLDGVGRFQDAQRPLADQKGSSFALVERTIARLLARGLQPHISITITRQSLPGLPELVSYLLDKGLRFAFNFYREPDGIEQEAMAFSSEDMIAGLRAAYRVIEQKLPRYSLLSTLADRADLQLPHLRTCGAGQNYVAIDCDGSVAKCQMEIGHSLTTIEADDLLADVQADTIRVQNLPVEQKDCRTCIWRYYCTGGCPRLTFQRAGRYDARSPLCEVYRAILPEVVRLEGLRLVKYEQPWDFSFGNGSETFTAVNPS